MLTVLDDYTREAVYVVVRSKMSANDVLDALYPLFINHGKPEFIISDNGPEFVATQLREWPQRAGDKSLHRHPDIRCENGYNERYNGALRREVLNAEWSHSTQNAQFAINTWLKQYNFIRPHQALGMRPPVPETNLEVEKSNGTDIWG